MKPIDRHTIASLKWFQCTRFESCYADENRHQWLSIHHFEFRIIDCLSLA